MPKKRWRIHTSKSPAPIEEQARALRVDPLLIRILVNRGVPLEGFASWLSPSLSDLHDPHLLKDVEKAAGRLLQEIDESGHIRIIGDYDVDGICATCILHEGLSLLGADVSFMLPHRVHDGYGINVSLVEQAASDGVTLLLTCDNGVAAVEAARRAKELGLCLLVTDHHEVPADPSAVAKAFALVDPKQPDCPYPFSGICGAVVALKLLLVLFGMAGLDEEEAFGFLPYAALATICDVMPLVDENRSIVRLGLEAIGQIDNPGLRALIEACGLDPARIEAGQVGFRIGPCLNASGRLDTASRATALLLEPDPDEAKKLASELVALNEERRRLTEEGMEKAVAQVETQGLLSDPVLTVYLPGVHESLAGLIAGRLRERYNRPSFVLVDAEDCIKGSGRSIEAYSMYEELYRRRELFLRFGGHPMAAGLSLPSGQAEAFRRAMNDGCSLTDADLVPCVTIDCDLPFSYLSLERIRQLNLLGPFGSANPKPVFARRGVQASGMRSIGKEGQYRSMTLSDGGIRLRAVCFRCVEELEEALRASDRIDICYEPQLSEYMGEERIELVVSEVRPGRE